MAQQEPRIELRRFDAGLAQSGRRDDEGLFRVTAQPWPSSCRAESWLV